ncbi:MAG: carbonic anhydrase [Longimicrobiales bacterium]|nr:carbonic anhydrase [Longimicrobiales bacterium]
MIAAASSSLSRREVLRAAMVGSAALAATAIPLRAEPELRRAPRNPQEALDRLMAGNTRFMEGDADAPRRSLARVRELTSSQSPYAAVLGCADSRVPVEILFDEGFGDLFTVRVAGNVATPEEIASLEYAVGVLGSRLVLVLGHSGCGAVSAARDGAAVPGQISSLFQHIRPAIPAGSGLPEAVEANVRHQAEVLRSSSTVIREALDAGRVAVRGAVYSLEDGRVRLIA